MNKYGRHLLDLYLEAKHRVLNGRVHGDFQEHLAYKGFMAVAQWILFWNLRKLLLKKI